MTTPLPIGDRSYGIIALRIKPGTNTSTASTPQASSPKPTTSNSQVLLIQQKTMLGPPTHPPYWGFPKGHSEACDPSIKATAIRELYEETSLVATEDDIILGDEKEFKEVYVNPLRKVGKEVRYWVAVIREGEKEVRVQEREVAGARWCGWKEASGLITYEETRGMFHKVMELLGDVGDGGERL